MQKCHVVRWKARGTFLMVLRYRCYINIFIIGNHTHIWRRMQMRVTAFGADAP